MLRLSQQVQPQRVMLVGQGTYDAAHLFVLFCTEPLQSLACFTEHIKDRRIIHDQIPALVAGIVDTLFSYCELDVFWHGYMLALLPRLRCFPILTPYGVICGVR